MNTYMSWKHVTSLAETEHAGQAREARTISVKKLGAVVKDVFTEMTGSAWSWSSLPLAGWKCSWNETADTEKDQGWSDAMWTSPDKSHWQWGSGELSSDARRADYIDPEHWMNWADYKIWKRKIFIWQNNADMKQLTVELQRKLEHLPDQVQEGAGGGAHSVRYLTTDAKTCDEALRALRDLNATKKESLTSTRVKTTMAGDFSECVPGRAREDVPSLEGVLLMCSDLSSMRSGGEMTQLGATWKHGGDYTRQLKVGGKSFSDLHPSLERPTAHLVAETTGGIRKTIMAISEVIMRTQCRECKQKGRWGGECPNPPAAGPPAPSAVIVPDSGASDSGPILAAVEQVEKWVDRARGILSKALAGGPWVDGAFLQLAAGRLQAPPGAGFVGEPAAFKWRSDLKQNGHRAVRARVPRGEIAGGLVPVPPPPQKFDAPAGDAGGGGCLGQGDSLAASTERVLFREDPTVMGLLQADKPQTLGGPLSKRAHPEGAARGAEALPPPLGEGGGGNGSPMQSQGSEARDGGEVGVADARGLSRAAARGTSRRRRHPRPLWRGCSTRLRRRPGRLRRRRRVSEATARWAGCRERRRLDDGWGVSGPGDRRRRRGHARGGRGPARRGRGRGGTGEGGELLRQVLGGDLHRPLVCLQHRAAAGNIYNKTALNIYPFPWAVALWQMAFGWLIFVPLWLTGIRKTPKLTIKQAITLSPAALGHLATHVGAVVAFFAGAVSFGHIVKASEPVVSSILNAVFLGEVLAWQVYAALTPIIAGVAIASASELSFTWLCFGAAMGSNLGSAARAVYSKKVMSGGQIGENMDSANTYAVLTIMATFMLIPISLAIEGPSAMLKGFHAAKAGHGLPFVMAMLYSGFTYYMYNEVAFLALGKLDAVSHAVCNAMKRVVIIIAAIVVFKTPVTATGIAGSSIAIAGTLLYSLAKNKYPSK
ncbi:unnamed protein product [Prorocentrum cordatum]|uniref:Sugar phosphate transporter domain-containing protein n=1 Tax=Prorocentrum cordatum TaxID=2364126 RepID=A0ABN9TP55_9DINO|nr:unnamed protein product [Polarella glacialis]